MPLIIGRSPWWSIQSGSGDEPGEQVRAVLDLSEPAGDQCRELVDGALRQVDQRSFQVRPDSLDRVELWGVGGN